MHFIHLPSLNKMQLTMQIYLCWCCWWCITDTLQRCNRLHLRRRYVTLSTPHPTNPYVLDLYILMLPLRVGWVTG